MADSTACADNCSCRQDMEVRWGDCDAAGIVYYVKYFDWFTDGRTYLLKQANLPHHAFFLDQGILMVTIEAHCRYIKPMRPETPFCLHTRLTGLSRSKVTFEYAVTSPDGGLFFAQGKTVHAYVDDTGKPFDIKKRHPGLWEKLCLAFPAACPSSQR